MGREIKFRAWDNELESFNMNTDINLYTEFNKDLVYVVGGVAMSGIVFEQFTGLKDKNGKEIYEGDILNDKSDDEWIGVVEFEEGRFGIATYGIKGQTMEYGFDENAGGFGKVEFEGMDYYNIDELEVIGNIHENKELLLK